MKKIILSLILVTPLSHADSFSNLGSVVSHYSALVERAKIAIKYDNYTLYQQDLLDAYSTFSAIQAINKTLDLNHKVQIEQFPQYEQQKRMILQKQSAQALEQ